MIGGGDLFYLKFLVKLTAVELLLIINRKSHMSFQLVSTSMNLSDLERRNSPYFAFFHRI